MSNNELLENELLENDNELKNKASDDKGTDDKGTDGKGTDDKGSTDTISPDDLDRDGSNDDKIGDSGGADNWFGGLGDDSFIGGRGNDRIDGGSGIDDARYKFDHDNYTITKTATGLEITDNVGTDGHDILSNIERLTFTDTSIAFDIDGNAGQAYRLYKAAFNRESDSTGLGFWIETLDSGSSLLDVAAGFTHSPEFQSLYGADSSNDYFVSTLYNNVLGREGEAGGHAFWLKLLDDGVSSREQVLVEFSESAENQSNAIAIIGDTGIDFIPFIG